MVKTKKLLYFFNLFCEPIDNSMSKTNSLHYELCCLGAKFLKSRKNAEPWEIPNKYVAVELTEDNHRQFFIPRGFAHGFSVLSEEAVTIYKCDNLYAPESEGAIIWNDPEIGIDWGLAAEDVVLSPKDMCHPMLKDAPELFDYNVDYYAE